MSLAGDLCEYLQAHRGARFDWARCNCAQFAAGWIKRATGFDALTDAAANSPRGWLRIAEQSGGLREAVAARLGVAEKPAAYASIGDIVLLPAAGSESAGGTLGICCGRTVACLAQPGGLMHIPRAHALCAWPLREVAAWRA